MVCGHCDENFQGLVLGFYKTREVNQRTSHSMSTFSLQGNKIAKKRLEECEANPSALQGFGEVVMFGGDLAPRFLSLLPYFTGMTALSMYMRPAQLFPIPNSWEKAQWPPVVHLTLNLWNEMTHILVQSLQPTLERLVVQTHVAKDAKINKLLPGCTRLEHLTISYLDFWSTPFGFLPPTVRSLKVEVECEHIMTMTAEMPALTHLEVFFPDPETEILFAWLGKLVGLKSLVVLTEDPMNNDDAEKGMFHLRSLTQLTALELKDCSAVDAVVEVLPSLPALRQLRGAFDISSSPQCFATGLANMAGRLTQLYLGQKAVHTLQEVHLEALMTCPLTHLRCRVADVEGIWSLLLPHWSLELLDVMVAPTYFHGFLRAWSKAFGGQDKLETLALNTPDDYWPITSDDMTLWATLVSDLPALKTLTLPPSQSVEDVDVSPLWEALLALPQWYQANWKVEDGWDEDSWEWMWTAPRAVVVNVNPVYMDAHYANSRKHVSLQKLAAHFVL